MSPDTLGDDRLDIRWLTASDPKRARALFQSMLDAGGSSLDELLSAASRPGDGRVRQMIATVYRTVPTAAVLEPWLQKWLAVETDEFTRTALESALRSRGQAPIRQRAIRNAAELTVDAYRFVADRLCHRVRNAMALPNAHLKRLEMAVAMMPDGEERAELTAILSGIQAGFVRIARNVEFDTDDRYLVWDAVTLTDWLSSQERKFSERFGPAQLVINGHPLVRDCRVRATPFLLDTLFGNLWNNAVQASEPPCKLVLECAMDAGRSQLIVVVLDSGPGFTEQHLDMAFQQVFSTKSASRGRGLLEIADAATRLQGSVELTRRVGGDYRVRLTLPLALT
jgi:signal transduction histidine kinase